MRGREEEREEEREREKEKIERPVVEQPSLKQGRLVLDDEMLMESLSLSS